jgi:exopolyphosphatase/guanosine-5'-triphosphate,3'-diphosphate pyrophosphatase
VTRVAAIDCGTNSIRLLIADVDDVVGGVGGVGGVDDGELVDVVRTLRIVRLGRGVDRTGRLDPAAIERTRVALADYAAEVERLGVARTRMVATSATRDAANRADFHDMVRDTLGAPAEVISGDEEAALSYAGAVRGLDAGAAPYLVVDIGGGSTEFVLGDAAGMWSARSVDIGCVRLTERHLRDDPPSPEQIAAAEADVRTALGLVRERVRVDEARSFVGLAGSVTTVAALALDLAGYDAARRLLAADQATRAAHPVIHPGRVDVIGAGALVLRVLVDELSVPEVVVSEHDILDGIAWSLARR